MNGFRMVMDGGRCGVDGVLYILCAAAWVRRWILRTITYKYSFENENIFFVIVLRFISRLVISTKRMTKQTILSFVVWV